MWEIVFLANAIGKMYENFVVPFSFFALEAHPNGFVEMVVESMPRFVTEQSDALKMLKKLHSRFTIREMENPVHSHHLPNTYRFLESPKTIGKYTYIMDVDVMLLENVVPIFESNWPKDCVVNNIIRFDSDGNSVKRLTGMHMVKTAEYYTDSLCEEQQRIMIQKSHKGTNNNDEHILYQLVEACHQLPPLDHRWRPILGIHFSPNRNRTSTPPLKTCKRYADMFLWHASQHPHLFGLPQFKNLLNQLVNDFKIVY